MTTSDEIKESVERYAAAVSSADRDAIVACFAEDAVVVDPYPSEAHVGKAAIAGFWDGVLALGKPLALVPEKIVASGDRAAFNFHITLAVGDGARVGIEGIDVVTVDGNGKISELTAYFDPGNVHSLPPE